MTNFDKKIVCLALCSKGIEPLLEAELDLLGLEINPNHVGINEYLGELYVATNRLDLAKERLKILESCSCEEYTELKEIIEGTKTSKY